MNSYKELEVWKKSMDLCVDIYGLTKNLPDSEKFGLVSQMRRAAVSIPSNMAEGASRNSTKEFIQFLYISNGSLSEIETQLELALRLRFMKESDVPIENIKLIRKMLINLIKALKNK